MQVGVVVLATFPIVVFCEDTVYLYENGRSILFGKRESPAWLLYQDKLPQGIYIGMEVGTFSNVELLSTEVLDPRNVTEVKPIQFQNASSPMLVTELGIVMEVKLLQ